MRRAQRLGLTYPEYAKILLGSGRDIVGFLFTVNGLQLRLSRRVEIDQSVADKLARLAKEQRMSLSPHDEAAEAFAEELSTAAGCSFAAVAPAPSPAASWSEMRRAVRAALAPLRLPSDAVVMVGDDGAEPDWSAAAELAGHIAGSTYFSDRV